MTGQALATPECDAAAARWVELMPPGSQEGLEGKSWQESFQDTDKRYLLVVASWVGVAMVVQAGHERGEVGDKRLAELVLTGDTLRQCWRSDLGNGTAERAALVDQFDDVYTPERLAAVRGLAEAIMKDGN